MSLRVDMRHNFKQIEKELKLLEKKAPVVFRQSLNRALERSARKQMVFEIQKRVKIKKFELIRKTKKVGKERIQLHPFIWLRKAKGRDINAMKAVMSVSGNPLSMLRFVKGRKEPENQKGKRATTSGRRKIKTEVRPGKVNKAKGLFIIKGSGGKNILVRRIGNEIRKRKNRQKGPVKVERTAALAFTAEKKMVVRAVSNAFGGGFTTEFKRNLDRQLQRMAGKTPRMLKA